MKKFCVIFVLFCAVFIISCDESNSSNSNGNSDSTDIGESVTDEDAADTDSTDTESTDAEPDDNESSDSEPADSEPDTSDTTPDGTDTSDSESDDYTDTTDSEPDDNADSESDDDTDTAEPEPTEAEKCAVAEGNWNAAESSCTKIAECTKPEHTVWNGNSSYIRTYTDGAWSDEIEAEYNKETAGTCHYKCATGYAWHGSSCDTAPTIVSDCTGLPDGAFWNSVDKITQTFDGENWEPSVNGVYDINPSSEECRFFCKPRYTWNDTDNECVAETQEVECTGLPEHAQWNEYDKVIQTWNGTTWEPEDTTGIYSETSSMTECRFICNLHYTWQNSACEADTQFADCSPKPEHSYWNDNGENGRFPQEWTETGWTPESYESEYSTEAGICKYKCENNYFWTGSECVNPCDDNPCTGIDHSTGVCNASAWNRYTCGCENNYFWTGSECVNPCDDNPCTGIDHSTGVCNASAWNSYSCECENYYLWKKLYINHHLLQYSCINPCEGIAHADGTWTQDIHVHDSLNNYNCGCENNYFWNGSECVNPCEPCNNDALSTSCSATDWNNYNCRCKENYFWNGSECAFIPECSPSSGTPCKSGNLMWSEKTNGFCYESFDFSSRRHCDNLTEGGYNDWRWPNIDELKTLITNCTDGSCSKFGDTDIFASSTTKTEGSSFIEELWWYVDFSTGDANYWTRQVLYFESPVRCYSVRCVR